MRYVLSLSLLILFCLPSMGVERSMDVITHRWITPGTVEEWSIVRPNVAVPTRDYRDITFREGDRIQISAGGCVQTGGKGKTWKRYVNPSGPNSDRLYFGQFAQPGYCGGQMIRISDAIQRTFVMHVDGKGDCPTAPLLFLRLGYVDDKYGDNGYSNHDDGTEDQCRTVGDAVVIIRVTHQN
jgi:hypothetical protein